MFRTLAALALGLTLAYSPSIHGHGGGVDSIGGHASTDGGYHFHIGPLAGEAFASASGARAALDARGAGRPLPEVKIASFNIRIFSNGSRNDDELGKIVARIQAFDLVAIQELRDEKVLKRAKVRLESTTGVEWWYEMSGQVGRGVKERYAFLYRADRVLVRKQGKLVADPKGKFIREPYYATFRAGNFDFVLLTIHALFRKKNAPERKLEFDALASAFVKIRDSDPHECDVILLGDFNDDSGHPRFAALRGIEGMRCLFLEPIRTTIGDKSLYDNICFQEKYVSEFSQRLGVDKFDETEYGGDLKKASLEVSDHRPVWAVFRTDRDDD